LLAGRSWRSRELPGPTPTLPGNFKEIKHMNFNTNDIPDVSLDFDDFSLDFNAFDKPFVFDDGYDFKISDFKLTPEEEKELKAYLTSLDELMAKHKGNVNAVIKEIRKKYKRSVTTCPV
jgi:hypothetical protein